MRVFARRGAQSPLQAVTAVAGLGLAIMSHGPGGLGSLGLYLDGGRHCSRIGG